MDYGDLFIFMAVAEELSFRKAARRLHISQPTLSRKITRLEEHYGVRFFYRDNSVVSLTAEGAAFQKIAERLLQDDKKNHDILYRIKSDRIGKLTIGLAPSFNPSILTDVIIEFMGTFPDAVVSIHENVVSNLDRLLTQNQIDFFLSCILPDYYMLGNFLRMPLFEDRMILIAKVGYFDRFERNIGKIDFSRERFIHYRPNYQLRFHVDSFLFAQGLSPVNRIEVGTPHLMNNLVGRGLGIAITTRLNALDALQQGFIEEIPFRELSSRSIPFIAVLRNDSTYSSIAETFLASLQAKVSEWLKCG